MSYDFTGTVKKIFEGEQKTDKFKVRDLVCESVDEKYSQLIKFQFTNDRCDLLDKLNVGDQVCVSFDLRGREWNDKYFTNLNGWKVEKLNSEQSGDIVTSKDYKPSTKDTPSTSGNDDIPF